MRKVQHGSLQRIALIGDQQGQILPTLCFRLLIPRAIPVIKVAAYNSPEIELPKFTPGSQYADLVVL